jgi:hypothetical protein
VNDSDGDVPLVPVDDLTGILIVIRASRYFLLVHIFELMIGVLAIVSGLRFFFVPDEPVRALVGDALSPWDLIWNVGYLLGGVGVVFGLVRRHATIEAAGCCLLVAGMTIVATLTAFYGPSFAVIAASVTGYAALSSALVTRAWVLWKVFGR